MLNKLRKYLKFHPIVRKTMTLAISIGMLVLLLFAVQEKKKTGINEFLVSIEYEDVSRRLINKEYIRKLIQKEMGFNVAQARIEDLSLLEIEKILNDNPFISMAQVYIDANNSLRVEIVQKNPVVRINGLNGSFYLDQIGDYLPWSPVATVRVPVVTGDLIEFRKDYIVQKENQYKDIFQLAIEIEKDEFLKALVEQIHFKTEREIYLIPKIGKEKIILGDIYRLDEKLFKLKQFYKEGLTREGWGKYAYLDLKYEDLVYARKD